MPIKIFDELKLIFYRDKISKEISSGTAFSLMLKLLGLLLGYIYSIVIVVNFNAEVLGNFVLCGIILSFIEIIAIIGMDNTVLAYTSQNLAMSDTSLSKTVLIKSYSVVIPAAIILTIILYFISGILSIYVFKNESLKGYLQLISFAILPVSVIKLNAQFLRGLKKINEFVFLSLVSTYLFSILSLYAILFYTRSYESVLISFLSGIFITVILSFFLIKNYIFKVPVSQKQIVIKELLKVSYPIMYSEFLKNLKLWIGPLIIGYYFFESKVGVYSLTFKLASVSSIFIYAVNSIAMPKYGELYGSRDSYSINRTLHNSSRITFWFSFPVITLVIILCNPIMHFLGKEFSAGLIPLVIISSGQIVEAIAGSSNYFLQVVNKQNIYFRIVALSTLLHLVLNFLFVPVLDINGAAISYAVSTIFQVVVIVLYIKKKMNYNAYYIPYFLRKMVI